MGIVKPGAGICVFYRERFFFWECAESNAIMTMQSTQAAMAQYIRIVRISGFCSDSVRSAVCRGEGTAVGAVVGISGSAVGSSNGGS